MNKLMLSLAFFVTVLSFTILVPMNSDRTHIISFLERQGDKDVELTGFKYFSCGRDDFYKDGFKAINVNGHNVSGVVCEGVIFKSKTVRID